MKYVNPQALRLEKFVDPDLESHMKRFRLR